MNTNTELLQQYSLHPLEEWTGLRCGEIIFSTDKTNWNRDTPSLNQKIIGKKQLAFIFESSDREIFGYYHNPEILEKYFKPEETCQQADFNSFHFNLQCRQNRLHGPMKFELLKLYYYGVQLYDETNRYLIYLC